jgi:uncharacterized lipoprotein YddW (UPF0748 family)
MKRKSIRAILSAAIILMLLIPFFAVFPVSAASIQPVEISGINIERKLNFLVVYTDEYSSGTTKTDDKGIEAVVNSEGKVIAVGGNNNDIPKGGFVISGSSTKKTFIEKNIKVGYGVYLDKDIPAITVIPSDYNPFYSKTIEFTSINTTRYENYIVIYDGKDGKKSTATNQWGYEVAVDKNGFIISVGGNNTQIPEGGFVISAIGNKKATFTEMAKIGLSAKYDTETKLITISYSKENAVESPRLLLDNWKNEYNTAKKNYRNIDYSKVEDAIKSLESELNKIKQAIEKNDMLSYTVAQNSFDKLSANLKTLLTESPAVEGRAIWIRPTQTTSEDVKKVIKEIYESGFNIVCIEGLFNNTVIMPMPDGSYLQQNPTFKNFDVLAAYIEECHKYGMEIHLWMPTFRVAHEGSNYPELGFNKKKPEWINIANTGINYVSNEYGNAYFLNPALPEVHDYLLSIYKYILEKYSVDGFQLDYIRYPDMVNGVDYGYDDYTRNLFKEKYNKDPKEITQTDALWKTWYEFRAQFVTDFVLKVKDLVKEIRPDIYLSCDVAPSYDESISRMKQDTKSWLTNAYIDMVYPMAYGNVTSVDKWSKSTVELAGNKVFTYIGLGDYGADTLFDEIVISRDNGADGIAFFAYAQFKEGDYKSIPETIFAYRAVSPSYNGKKAAVAQLKFMKTRIKNIILPSKADGSAELDALCPTMDELITRLESSGVAACKDDINKLISAVNAVLGDKVKDNNLKNAVSSDLRLFTKITSLSKDEEKAAYYKDHPLPQKYTLSEDLPNQSTSNPSGTEKPESKLSTSEKVIRGIAIGVMAISVLGLPVFFLLERRKKKAYDESNTEQKSKSEDEQDKENKNE